AVPHSPLGWAQPVRWLGGWEDDTLPLPRDIRPRSVWKLEGPISDDTNPLDWSAYSHPPPRTAPARPSPQSPMAKAAVRAPIQSPAHVQQALAGIALLANQLGESSLQLSQIHGRFLEDQIHATTQMGHLADALERASLHLNSLPITVRIPPPVVATPVTKPVSIQPQTFSKVPRTYDFDALIRHASGPISSVFGSTYADIDGYEPRVRMPMPPLLLCSRVVHIEGERGEFGPSRIVTEYDIPEGQDWTSDGRPPPCVMIESGQADLFLVSFLGIDAALKGDRIYRLLDCDLNFHGPIPKPGETLRHDIKIDRFARLGATTLFYFHYDCTAVSDGRAVLSMRNGVAGFFTPAELAIPKGVDDTPAPQPQHAALEPLLPNAASSLTPDNLHNLSHGRFADCFGPSSAAADHRALRLPDSQWCLIHRVPQLTLTGAPYGLGEVVYEQDLRDDDWFNPCHFVGDPCMPGTLMYDGCMQAVQLWLLGQGVSAAYPDGSFDPLPECSTKLRCRGQVVPGHSTLTYRARIKRAGMTPTPWAIADVILEVDGTPVVLAEDVGVCVSGDRVAFAAPVIGPAQDKRRLMEYSVGSAVTAFGPAYANNDGPGQRCARMPGPPYLTMSEVVSVDGPPMDIAAPRTVEILWDVPERAWFWGIRDNESMPYAILLETALQPCGWLTAYQGGGIVGSADLYFRNLGGTGTQLAEVWPHTGPLRIVATQTSVSASGGMQVQFFQSEVWSGDQVVFRCKTHFGYFTKDALGAQKGLMLPAPEEARIADTRTVTALPTPIELDNHAAMPRDDWRMVQRITHAGSDQGAH
ncbi:MAG: hypothetical protein GWP91_04295, partial [Rhodobacterales bacterium]|nr:hypothetical protein [Rhodobacterales bacterium]